MTQPNTKFIRRDNKDGTVDSVCRNCFVTIATARWKSDLEREESKHVCETYGLQRLHVLNSSPTP
jgi:hypothetical protein